jgi:hypothetical protein
MSFCRNASLSDSGEPLVSSHRRLPEHLRGREQVILKKVEKTFTTRVARWLIFLPKIPIWRALEWKLLAFFCYVKYFSAIL